MRKRGSSSLGSVVAIVFVIGVAWLGLRSMLEKQRAAYAPRADASTQATYPQSSGPTLLVPIPQEIVERAGKTKIARLDVVLRVDGLDLSFDGAPACRDGHRRLVGRAPDSAIGSFDERALASCVAALRAQHPGARLVAVVTRAGPAVPTTYGDALLAALRRAGVADVVPAL